MIVHLVRHGEVANPQRIVYGSLPGFALSAAGIAQAQRVAVLLAEKPLSAVFTSPLLRARQTAAPIAELHSLRFKTSRLLTETDEGRLEGLPLNRITAQDWAAYSEPPSSSLSRIARFLRRCIVQFAGTELVAVTHGDNIGFLHLALTNRPLRHEDKMTPAFGSIFTVCCPSITALESWHCEWNYVEAP